MSGHLVKITKLGDDRMRLVPVTSGDAEVYSELRNGENTYKWFFSEKKYSQNEVMAWIEGSISKGDINLFGYVDDRLVGAVSLYNILHNPYWQADIGRVMVVEDQRGRGYGKMLIREASKLAREKGLETLAAYIKENNLSSRRAFESVGYKDTLNGSNGVLEYLAPPNFI